MTNLFYRGKRVLITGGLGFIGSTLAIRLVELGAKITLLDCELPDSGANRFNIAPIESEVKLVMADLGNETVLSELIPNQDYIFNLAGTLSHTDSMRDPLRDLHSNCSAHIHLLESCRKLNPGARVLYAGTRGQYGKPQSLPVHEDHPLNASDANGINKTAGEAYHLLYSRSYGMHCTSLRLSNTYGPRHQMRHARQGVLNWFVRQVLDNNPITLFGDGTQIRDVHYVDDVVEAMLLALANDQSKGEVFNLGGQPLSLKQIAELLTRLNSVSTFVMKPYPPDAKGVEIGDYVADMSKIQKVLGWNPKTLPEAGFRKTIDYYRENKAHYW